MAGARLSLPPSFVGLSNRDRCGMGLDEYEPGTAFSGKLHRVTIDLSGELITDSEAEIRMAMARQ
jgi:hypothetical protein